MAKKVLFIYNPNAGKAAIKNKLSDIIEIFNRAEFEVTIHATQKQGDCTNLICEKGEQYDMVICSGGDGTLNEAVTGLMTLENPPECGYIPAGTVNDFATSLKIPKKPLNAATTIVDGRTFACDVGQFQDRYFTYIAGFGAFTEVAYETSQSVKNVLGKTAYFLDGVKRIPSLRGYNMKIEHDGIIIEGNYIFGMICNSQSVGGFKLATGNRRVKMDDGLFEAVFIRMPKNPIELEQTLNALITRNVDVRYIDAFRSKKVKVIAEEPIAWTLDGESGGTHTEIVATNLEHALRIRRPQKK